MGPFPSDPPMARNDRPLRRRDRDILPGSGASRHDLIREAGARGSGAEAPTDLHRSSGGRQAGPVLGREPGEVGIRIGDRPRERLSE